jgi:energy-coupling factor transporter ATP-binding protein EcfA2
MERISRGTSGARYIKADLHVHTPGSHDYQADISPEELVDCFLEQGLELVAVTDHDCAGMYEEIREAAEGKPIEILPGVEITTPQGGDNQIHMTAIFPPEEHDAVNHVLSQIGINPERAGEEQASSRIKDICKTVLENGGLPILAHIDEAAGAHEETGPGRIRERIFDVEQVAAIEVVDSEFRFEYPEFPAIRSSDAHHPDQLGRGFTYLKMTEPSFSGLRTALSDPDLRIAYEEVEQNHPLIEGVHVRGKFLNDRAVQFNRNLNCLIGGKGTGKSSVIEHLRYAFDIEPRTQRITDDYTELIDETLGPDGEIDVYISTTGGQRYLVSRRYGERPQIHREVAGGDDEEVEMNIETFRSEFFDLEIHSQREILELARDERDQLELVDSYLDFGDAKRERERIKSELRDNAQDLRSARGDRDRLESEITDYGAVRENIALMEEQGVDEHLEGEEKWEQEGRRLDRYVSQIQNAATAASEFTIFEETPTEEELDDLPNQELVEAARSEIFEAISDIEELKDQITSRLQVAEESVVEQKEEWDNRHESRREEYQELADEIEEETGVNIEEYFDLKEQESRLAGVQSDLDSKEEEIEGLEEQRRNLLRDLEGVRRRITDIRRRGINDIDGELTEEVRVQLEPNSNKEHYVDWFNTVLQGSRVRTQDKETIAEEYDPDVLARIIEEKDAERLVDDVNITATAADNIVNHDDLRARTQELQTLEIHDRPIIEIRDQGEWKTLSHMSDGQQCTALLSIAMLERDRPLVVDQPEDMLDNEFIYDVVVDVIKRVKQSRQIIAATHNANIPILGDAEQILVMWSNGYEGFFQNRGSIDLPEVQTKAQKILEGGKEAFNHRTRKYGILE